MEGHYLDQQRMQKYYLKEKEISRYTKNIQMKMQGLSRTKPINFLPKFHWGFYNQKSFLACYLKSQQHCQDLFV